MSAAPDDLASWLRLMQIPGIGADTARRLLGTFGLPENILSAGFSALQKVVPERIAHALVEPPSAQDQEQIDRALEWATQDGNHILTLADADYPPALLDISDPPILLYAKGNIHLLANASLAVVGSRNATAQGISNAEKFSEALAHAGLTIISGMALGIDTAAHQGALLAGPKGARASTIAVIGTGADLVYPARNRKLAHQIAANGCIISEHSLGTPAIASNFPRRNRIISGLARGVLVIEAALQSGSLITARMAAEQGREVFAIPGSIHSPLSKGCHLLIKQGAKLVESAQDILEELKYQVPKSANVNDAAEAVAEQAGSATHPILQAMGFDPVTPDALAQRCQLDIALINAKLLVLELDGEVEQLSGGLYQRLSR